MAKETKKQRKTGRIVLLSLLAIVIFGLTLASSIYYFNKYTSIKNYTPSKFNDYYSQKILAKVVKLTQLPKDEQPSQILEISDKNTANIPDAVKQAAENGDVWIIYIKSKTSILYRPSSNIVVKTFPLTEENTSANTDAVKIKVIGASTARESAASTLTDKLKDQITIVDKSDAVGSYTTVTVVDVTGKNTERVKDIANVLNGTVGELPAGETKPTNADILVIVSTS